MSCDFKPRLLEVAWFRKARLGQQFMGFLQISPAHLQHLPRLT